MKPILAFLLAVPVFIFGILWYRSFSKAADCAESLTDVLLKH